MADAVGDACLIVDPEGVILAANGVAAIMYQCDQPQLVGRNVVDLCIPEETNGVLGEIAVCNGRPRAFRALQQRADGTTFLGEFSAKSCHDAGEDGVLLLIRENSSAERPLIQDLTLRTLMLNHVSDGLVCHTPDGRLLFANKSALHTWGVSDLKAARALGPFGWVAEEQREHLSSLMERMIAEGELRFESHGKSPSGGQMHLEIHSTVIDSPDGVYIVSATRNITERIATEEMVRYLAYHDTLTGLGNRVLLESDLEHAISVSQRADDCVGVIYLDLDNFKPVNDTYGHAIGDAVLREVANRLAESVREGDTVTRPGGDEFVVIIPRLKQPQDLTVIAHKLADRVAEPMLIDGIEIRVRASVGLAVHELGENAEDVMIRADLAMYGSRHIGEAGWKTFVSDEAK